MKNNPQNQLVVKSGILLQGAIHEDFTTNAASFYLEQFPHSEICISTWDDTPTIIINKITALDRTGRLRVVVSQKPAQTGYQNVNLQLVSTYAGVADLMQRGCEIVLKSRTDFQINNKRVFEFYLSNAQAYNKILGIEAVDIDRNLFFISDFALIGPSHELLLMFTPHLQYCNNNRNENSNMQKQNDCLLYHDYKNRGRDAVVAERYLVYNYLLAKGYFLPVNLFEMLYFWPIWLKENFYLMDVDFWNPTSVKSYPALGVRNRSKFAKFANKINSGTGVQNYIKLLIKYLLFKCNELRVFLLFSIKIIKKMV
jgi:hypothetical protein